MESKELPWTGERLVPSVHGDIALEHLHRYAIATALVAGLDVLDIASGEGYGSQLLAVGARSVVGVDIAPEAVRHARAKYARANLSFLEGSCTAIPLPDAGIDLVVSFETIEHILEHGQFLAEVLRVLRKGGLLLISTPERSNYDATLAGANPFHQHELTRAEFEKLLRGHFAHVQLLGQRVAHSSVILGNDAAEPRKCGVFTGDFRTVGFSEDLPSPTYVLALCSDAPLPAIPVGNFEFKTPRMESTLPLDACIVQVFGDQGAGYSEALSARKPVVPDVWQTIRFDHLESLHSDPQRRLRIDMVNRPALVEVAGIRVVRDADSAVLYDASSEAEFRRFEHSEGVLTFSEGERLILLATDSDPQLLLPLLPDFQGAACGLEFSVRVTTAVPGLLRRLHERTGEKQNLSENLKVGMAQFEASAALWNRRHTEVQSAMEAAKARASSLADDLDAARKEIEERERVLAAARGEIAERQLALEAARGEAAERQLALEAACGETAEHQRALEAARGEAAEHQRALEAARGEAAAHQRALETARGEAAERQLALETARGEAAEHQRALEAARGEAAAHQRALEAARGEAAAHQRALETARGEAAERQRALETARSETAERQRTLEVARGDIAELQGTLEATRGDVAGLQRALDATRRELEIARGELHGIKSSVLWWLSTPFRWFGRLASRLKRSIGKRLAKIQHRLLPIALRIPWNRRLRRLREEWELIRRSRLIDSRWYFSHYPIGRRGPQDPVLHYLCEGAGKGHSPSPLFHAQWYLANNPDVARSGLNPLVHYLKFGAMEGREPNPLFATSWYLRQYPDVAAAGLNPLLHYMETGWREGRDPSPGFDSSWYLEQYPDVARSGENPLVHFLRSGLAEERNPNPLFDTAWYLRQYPDVAAAGVNPLLHYMGTGWREGRDPHPCFSTRNYLLDNPDVAAAGIQPLAHYLLSGVKLRGLLAPYSATVPKRAGTTPCSYEPELVTDWPEPDVRLIAFYLPQYHRIPENDAWWGDGFTEWTNVRAGRPNFPGHYQPQVPHPTVDYYDLSDETVLQRQAELARRFGIQGFCFYHYWFGGTRLLDMPVKRFLRSGVPDFPFCLCWANENWTRRWDGMAHDILISQNHSLELDEQFIRDVLPAMQDHRYIRVNGRPFFLIYRPLLLPAPAATFLCWREVCRAEGLGEIFLAGVQGFGFMDPRPLGLDAAVEFPPNVMGAHVLPREQIGAFPHFTGTFFDYQQVAQNVMFRPVPHYPLFRGVMPSWDNTARCKERGSIFLKSSPEDYFNWLSNAVQETRLRHAGDERIVFINAWNEWGEGCHLEPDEKYGFAWLNATRRALLPSSTLFPAPVLIIGHDAERAGAQNVLLSLLREWKRTRPFPFCLLLNGDGAMRSEFEACCPTLVLSDHPAPEKRRAALDAFLITRPRLVFSNTVVNGPLLKELQWLAVPVITHVHELQKSIERWASGTIFEATLEYSKHFIAVSPPVAANLQTRHQVAPEAITLIHEFIDTEQPAADAEAAARLRTELDAAPQDILVFGCGTTDWRKGPDLFVEIAAECRSEPRLRFAWIGGGSAEERAALDAVIERHGLAGRVRFLGQHSDPRRLLPAGQIFLLSSREDPFPLVALEAADAGLPVVCFADAGGMPDFVGSEECGITVPFADTLAAAGAIRKLSSDESLRARLGEQARQKVRREHSTPPAAVRIAQLVAEIGSAGTYVAPSPDTHPLVSVIVPNYNHAPFLSRRLESIAAQGIQNMEIILLDDASTDGSREILSAFASTHPRTRLVLNAANSGSTFKQWRKGLEMARGHFVWIAESDDCAEPGLVAALVHKLQRDPDAVIAYSQSQMIDDSDRNLGLPLEWTADLSPTRWLEDFEATGTEEIRTALSIKNSIPNASAVVFRNFEGIVDLVDETMRLCADWLFWVRLCRRGGVIFDSRPLNRWRQRTSNARTRPPGELEWLEGARIVEECADALGASPHERDDLLSAFRARCEMWRGTAVPVS
jgi:glycosyltransferase involved in cell wall biosynthesis/SAM-dependent methyltransferase